MDNTILQENQNAEEESRDVEEASLITITGEKEEQVIERPYQLRRLMNKDLFPLLKILRKIGVGEFRDVLKNVATEEKTMKDIGIDTVLQILNIIIENIPAAEEDIYDFWSDLSGCSVDEIREMEFGTLPLMIMDTFKGVRDYTFFKVLFKLL